MAVIIGKEGKVKIGSAFNIEGISNDTEEHVISVTLDTALHGLATGDRVIITGVVGMTDLNGYHTVLDDADEIITISLTTAQSYTSGGTVQKHVPFTDMTINEEIGEIDVSDSESGVYSDFIAGKRISVDGTITGYMREGVKPLDKGTELSFKIEADANSYWEVTAFVRALQSMVPIKEDGVAQHTYTIRGTGELVETIEA
jgi:hypothetical protein